MGEVDEISLLLEGLSQEDARKRLRPYGPNEIAKKGNMDFTRS